MYHPAAVTLDHVVAEPVKADFFQKPAGVVDELGVNQRRAMTQVRHVAECPAVPCLVLTWMKTFPVTRKFPALRRELCPARSSIERIYFLIVNAAVMIEYEIYVHQLSRPMS